MSLPRALIALIAALTITVASAGPISSTIDQANHFGQEERVRQQDIRKVAAASDPGLITRP